ncbi:MAG TPA: GWxTD domain-containing protein [Thermoanaerobaculia bacterium]|nr:GWxTD domain-containing protein [Thermoanaerobaculia bacterium]
MLAGCSGQPSPAAGPAAELTAGPLRWLMLPEEVRQIHELRTGRDTADFLEAFWRRRDPDPGAGVNECARRFRERALAADRLYGEDGRRGSLTDRGRALVLLGPPPLLRYGQRRIAAWEPGRSGAQSTGHSRLVAIETWIYPLADLSPRLAELLATEAAAADTGAVLVFLAESPRRTRLLEGEHVLQLAARALVRDN